jgi:hypothetical protein
MSLSVSMDKVIEMCADELLLTYNSVFTHDDWTRNQLIHVLQRAVSRAVPPQLVNLDKELAGRWMFIRDDSGHWYMIPAAKQAQFNDWVQDIENGTETTEDFDRYRLPGSPSDVTFTDPDRTLWR